MQTLLQITRKTGYLFLLFLLTISFSWGQGFEDFTNSDATSSYRTSSFVGNGSITWTYVESRDENGDTNNSGIDGKALMLRRSSDNSKITSSSIPNGIGNFSVKLYKGFTGGGNRQVELFVNGISQGTSDAFDDFNAHVFEVNNINIDGNITIEIVNVTSNQIIIDDITWTSFGSGGNTGPLIANIVQDPASNMVTSSDAVDVYANIIDNDGIASAYLYWGTTSGNLTTSIEMIDLLDDGVFHIDTEIPAQANGTTVYYEIRATDAHATPATTISDEYNYTVQDPLPFEIPYSNGLRNEGDVTAAEGVGFTFMDTGIETGGEGYVKIDSGGNITTPAIDFSAYNEITVASSMRTYGSGSGRELTILIANDGVNFTSKHSFSITSSSYGTHTYNIDLSSYTGTGGRIKFEMTAGSGSIRFRDLNITGVETPASIDYEFTAGVWTPEDPSGVATSADDIYVYDGEADLTLDTSANNILIDNGATLNIHSVLTLAGDLDNSWGGSLVFKSTATSNGELGSVGGTISGDATVERYMSANRSYRMVSSAVTTSTSINANWQEGVNNTGTGPGDNQNPNPGFGTHITGSTTGLNGFDATISGNPSMFTVNEAAQAFEAIGNTDTNTLNAGEPYLLFVRGDRGINVASNTSIPTETVLRATGELKTGSVSQTFEMSEIGHFAMIGNPYQSSVDMESVLANSTNVNTNYYYIYDPTQATRGSYVTIDVTLNSPGQGDGNKFLQPGQGAQVASLAAGTMTINFSEADKAPGNQTATNATGNHSVNDMLAVQLFTTENFNNQGSVHDSFTMVFAEGNDNAVTSMDAVKPMNFDENFGRDHNGTYLSIERRAMPQEGEVFALYSSGYKNNSYTIKATVTGLEGSELYLHDQFTRNIILLDQGDINYTFEVDQDNPMSIATDRFSIQVQSRLGVEDNSSLSGVQLYPNPLNGSSFYVNAPKLNGEEVTLSINDMLGRLVYNAQHSFTDNATQIDLPKDINSGVYLVTLSSNGEAKTLRVIKQ